jgi:hypothetical protein
MKSVAALAGTVLLGGGLICYLLKSDPVEELPASGIEAEFTPAEKTFGARLDAANAAKSALLHQELTHMEKRLVAPMLNKALYNGRLYLTPTWRNPRDVNISVTAVGVLFNILSAQQQPNMRARVEEFLASALQFQQQHTEATYSPAERAFAERLDAELDAAKPGLDAELDAAKPAPLHQDLTDAEKQLVAPMLDKVLHNGRLYMTPTWGNARAVAVAVDRAPALFALLSQQQQSSMRAQFGEFMQAAQQFQQR